jgi:hypothetical protein
MPKYTVRLAGSVHVWTELTVEADSREEAGELAVERSRDILIGGGDLGDEAWEIGDEVDDPLVVDGGDGEEEDEDED